MRRVDDHRPGAVAECVAKLSRIKGEAISVRPKGHESGDRPGHRDTGAVGVVERLEEHDLIAGVDQSEHGRGEGLGGPAGDGDFAVGVRIQTDAAFAPGGNGPSEVRHAGHRGVLVVAGPHGAEGGIVGQFRTRVVGEALGKVDGPVLVGQGGHFGKDRGAEGTEPLGDLACRRR